MKFRLTLLLILFPLISIFAQTQRVKNNPYIDQRRIHYGFMIGVQSQDLNISHSGKVQENGEKWFAEIPSFSPGFSVGLVGDYAFTESLNLRFTPTLHFGNKTITFIEETSKETVTQDLKSNYIAAPVSIRYSALRLNNYRPYIMTGIAPMFDLSKRKETPITLKKYDLCFEIGIGCDLYLPYFKLIPELKFSLGLLNVIQKDRKDFRDESMIKYTDAIESAKSNMVTLSFYFE
ncbi:MAG: porin family protein [Bacteroidales bacterium]|nr:porin family protein [Bacteroidales bacterium]